MALRAPSLPVPSWLLRRAPRRTVRLRLTLLYGGLFLLAGAVLLTITYVLVANSQAGNNASLVSRPGGGFAVSAGPAGPLAVPGFTQVPPKGAPFLIVAKRAHLPLPSPAQVKQAYYANAKQLKRSFQRVITGVRSSGLHQLLLWSGIGLAIMALASAALGWLMAGRVLRPLRTMTARARRISDHNLHQRLALDGPEDELKELADAFDAVLGRLEGAFDAQRQFVANASHELRTPLTLERAMVEVALADPEADADSLRLTCQRVLATGEQQERLIEGLLTLARSQRGLEENEPLDLREVSGHVLEAFTANRNGDGVSLDSDLGAAAVSGDERLVERLVSNLVDNALRHNVANGWVHVWTGVRGGRPTLCVANSGPTIVPADVDALLEPFRRAGADRARHRDGHGLGLSIVAAIAAAHGARLRASPRAEGGLDVEVSFGVCSECTSGASPAPVT
jgi:signal transduction histidine kinase